ncbi:hypothetical protein [Streptomyces sp. NPDC047453]|uniref:hypothetical protein n=1 Tax=Streptomyces sp. NPDC047453 TaxID=3154812 RepID=UPI0033E39A4E
MAVVDGAWWGAWWAWMIAWLVAALGVLGACVLLLALAHRRLNGPRKEHPGLSICVYLHEKSVKNLDELGNYNAALERVSRSAARSPPRSGSGPGCCRWF